MAKISVIIPIYNVEKYLNKCLESIVNQTFRDIEIICVNDGSKDNSLQIVEKYAQKDKRIKIINKENGGLSSARNAGIDVATSEWISFVDSDDWLDEDTFEKLEKYFKQNPDIICFGTHLRGDVSPQLASSDAEYYRIKHKGFVNLTDEIRLTTDVATWNKIYKKSIIDSFNLRFPFSKHYEDYPFYWEYILVAKTAYYTDECFYNYLRRPNSIMANTFAKKSNKVIDHLYASEIIFDYCKKRNLLNSRLGTFAEIFMNCFWFAYGNSPKNMRKSVLFSATKLLQKFDLENSFNDKNDNILYLKSGKYYKIDGVDYDKNIWQKIFSIKNRRSKKVVKILGLKFSFNYEKKDKKITNLDKRLQEYNDYNIKQFTYFQNIEYETAYSIWKAWGATPELLSRLRYLAQSLYQWNIQCNAIWLIYISCLIEIGDTNIALDILKKYVDKHGLKDIEHCLPVADFAYKSGYANDDIKKASFVFKKLEENRKNKVFEKLIEGKTIAVVGNGPSELGKGKGKEIDSHDIIVRFNNYQIEGFEDDYGSKTDIWIKCSSDDIKHELKEDNINLIVYEFDNRHHILIDGYLEALNRTNILSDYFDFETHTKLRQKFNFYPSTGLITIEKILSDCNAKSLDVYGFSFIQETEDNYATHYFNDRDVEEAKRRSFHHSFVKESVYLRKLLDSKIKMRS